jgi:xylulokinase
MAYIGVDLGSTNIKAALYITGGQGAAHTAISGDEVKADREVPLFRAAMCTRPVDYTRKDQRVEFNADAVVAAVIDMLRELGTEASLRNARIKQISLTGQAESLILLGKNGRPLRPAISWMDERSKAECLELAQRFSPEECYAVTGQRAIIPTWPATKILYLSRTEPEIISETAFYIMLKDYVAYRLCGVLAADKSIATFSMYFDIHHGCYWQAMLDVCGIRKEQLPPLVEPCTTLGVLDSGLDLGNNFAGTTVNTGTLDHFAGMIGNGNVEPGGISESTGTVLAMATMARTPLSGKETAALHYGPFPGTMVLLPVAESGGICLEWFKNHFLPDLSYGELDIRVSGRGPGNLLFLPYLAGVNAPEFNSKACGVFFGLRVETDAIDMARAVMEGIAFLLERNLTEMRRGGLEFSHIISTGGAAKSDIWSQIKADICGLEVRIPAESEAACFGAAIIAAVSNGVFSSYKEAASACVRMAKSFSPGKYSALYRSKKDGFETLYQGMLKTAEAIARTAYPPAHR